MVAATLLLATFHAGHRAWAGLTLLCAFLYLGELYYNLEATLLAKSLALMATGALLLAARYALHKLEGGAMNDDDACGLPCFGRFACWSARPPVCRARPRTHPAQPAGSSWSNWPRSIRVR
jgi:hypothetical protein